MQARVKEIKTLGANLVAEKIAVAAEDVIQELRTIAFMKSNPNAYAAPYDLVLVIA